MTAVPHLRDERGVTLIEVILASALTLLLMSVGYTVLDGSINTAAAVTNRAENSDAARLAIDSLEADLRFANGVWLCPAATAALQTAGTAPADFCASPGTGTSLVVSVDPALSSGTTGIDPTCSAWIFQPSSTASAPTTTPAGLYEIDLGAASGSSIPTAPLSSTLGATVSSSSTGFSLPTTVADVDNDSGAETNRLVDVYFGVNQESALRYNSADTVTVQDLIAPQNLPLQDDGSDAPCS